MTENTFDEKTVAEILDAHDVECVDELPPPIQNNIREGPDADYDFLEHFRNRGD